jgi:hypothetical protein
VKRCFGEAEFDHGERKGRKKGKGTSAVFPEFFVFSAFFVVKTLYLEQITAGRRPPPAARAHFPAAPEASPLWQRCQTIKKPFQPRPKRPTASLSPPSGQLLHGEPPNQLPADQPNDTQSVQERAVKLSSDQAAVLLRADLANLAKKVKTGKTLSASERNRLHLRLAIRCPGEGL